MPNGKRLQGWRVTQCAHRLPYIITSPSLITPIHLMPFNLWSFYISPLSCLCLHSLPLPAEQKGHAKNRETAQTYSPWSWGLHQPPFYQAGQKTKPEKAQREKHSCHLGLGTKSACTEVQRFVTVAPWAVSGKRDITAPFHRRHRGFLASPPDHSTALPWGKSTFPS